MGNNSEDTILLKLQNLIERAKVDPNFRNDLRSSDINDRMRALNEYDIRPEDLSGLKHDLMYIFRDPSTNMIWVPPEGFFHGGDPHTKA